MDLREMSNDFEMPEVTLPDSCKVFMGTPVAEWTEAKGADGT